MSKLNIGVIGLGRLGRLYARYFLGRISSANLLAVSDIAEAAELFAAENGVGRCYRDYRDLLADDSIDAVVIVTPTDTHKEIAIAAAQSGKAIFCEKPLSLSVEEAVEMKATIEQTRAFFQMGFMRRFDRGYAAAKRKVDNGEIGKPIVFKSSSRDPFRPSLEYLKPEHSGGLFVDCGIHDIDLARWFMGEVRSLYSVGANLAYPEMDEIGDVDNAITSLTFASGALGVIDLSRSGVYGYDIRTEILGTKGTLKVGYLRETPLLLLSNEGVTHDVVPYFMQRFEQAYVDQLQDFVDNVLQGRAPSISCADGVAALQVALAATRSFKENRAVEVP